MKIKHLPFFGDHVYLGTSGKLQPEYPSVLNPQAIG